jgi:hypothetical protein
VQPANLVRGIAGALRFDPPEDAIALQLQDQLQRAGLEAVLKNICGLAPDSPLIGMIKWEFGQ